MRCQNVTEPALAVYGLVLEAFNGKAAVVERLSRGDAMIRIAFKKGYKYQLEDAFSLQTSVLPPKHIDTHFIRLTAEGNLTLARSYAWDGATGVPDIPSMIRASLVHDALYQLMRHDLLDLGAYRKQADQLMRQLCVEDGMNPLLANAAYVSVRLLGEHHARRESRKPLLFAP